MSSKPLDPWQDVTLRETARTLLRLVVWHVVILAAMVGIVVVLAATLYTWAWNTQRWSM